MQNFRAQMNCIMGDVQVAYTVSYPTEHNLGKN